MAASFFFVTRRILNALRRHRYAILLTAQLFVTFVDSFSHRLLGHLIPGFGMTVMMLLVFLIVFERRADRIVAFIVFIVAAAASVAHVEPSGSYHELSVGVIGHTAKFVLISFATFVILRNIFAQRVVRPDDVLGAVCGYLLAAGACADLFLLIEALSPGSFRLNPGFSAGFDTWDGRIAVLTNVSLASLTSIGSTAAVAVKPPATILIPLEALFGQFYIAVVVAQLVGARLSQMDSVRSKPGR